MNEFSRLANPGIESLGVYEPGRPIEEVARDLGFEDPESICKLASNENALGPSPRAIEAMRLNAARMHLYPDGGAYYLRKAIAEKLGVESVNVLPGNGSNELLELLGHVFLSPGKSIVMAEHAFVVYRLLAAVFGSDVIDVPMQALTHDLDAMLDAIREDTRIVFVSNPNNPTSTMVGQADIERFMSRVPDHVITCFDEAYIELLHPDRQAATLAYVREGRSVIVLRTFSKTYGLAGLRIGYGIAPAGCVGLLERVRQPFNVNAMAQAAALAALEDDAHVDATRAMLAGGIEYLGAALAAIDVAFVPPCANFMLVRVGEGRKVFEALMREGVIVRPMDGYGLPDYVRVTIGTAKENERFVDALKSVLN